MHDKQKAEQVIVEIRQGNRQAAANIIAALLASKALLGDSWGAIARLALSIGEVDLCQQAAICFGNLNKRDIERQVKVAAILAECGFHQQALDYALAFAADFPNAAQLNHFIGTLYQQMGKNEQSELYLRKAIHSWPNAGESWLTLSANKVFVHDDKDIAALERLVQETLPNRSAASAFYALGKAYWDTGKYEQAFDTFSQGAQQMKSLAPYDAAQDEEWVNALIASYTTENMAKMAQSQLSKNQPVFVLGLPRSGTTLLEHLLCHHSQIMGGAEVGLIPKVLMEMRGSLLNQAMVFQQKFDHQAHAWEYLSATYQYMVSQRFGRYGVIIDKSLNNSRYLGLIAKMFPSSPIIWMRRNVMDVAWSCFRTCFSGQVNWSWDLKDIGAFFKNEERLFQHWRTVLGPRLLTVAYEDLVASSEQTLKRVLEHCRLADEQLTDDFHLSKRLVSTSSTVQVRSPINDKAIGGASLVAKQLQPYAHLFIAEQQG